MSITVLASPLSIPLRMTFRQASATRNNSESVRVLASRGPHVGVGEGCPRRYQSGETQASALAWLAEVPVPDNLGQLREQAADTEFIDPHPAAWCALETALLDLFAREANCSVEGLLGQPEQPRRFCYSAVVGIDAGEALLLRCAGMGMTDIKLKAGLDLQQDQRAIASIRRYLPKARIRLDLNNAFGDAFVRAHAHLAELSDYWAIEEPFAPGHAAHTAALARELGVAAIVDEGVLTPAHLHEHAAHEASWLLNLKVSRVGGLLRALVLVERARALGWGIIVGAQAGETSLLTRAGQIVARAAGEALGGMEGGLGELALVREPGPVSLRFGRGGWLNLDAFALEPIGWGLAQEIEPT